MLLKKFVVLLALTSCATMRQPAPVSEKDQLLALEQKVERAVASGESKELADELFIKAVDSSFRGDPKLSVKLYQLLMKLVDSPYVERKYAVELIRAGELKSSLPYLQSAFDRSGDQSVGLILSGVHIALDQVGEAQKIYRKILKREPASQEACVFLAKSYASANNYKKAYRQLDRCEKVAASGDFIYYKGRLEFERGHFKKAERFFQKALKKNKSLYQAAVALGLIYEQDGKFEKARKLYKNFVVKNAEDNYAVLAKLVQVMFALGQTKEVIPYLERLSELDQSDLNMKVKLGILYTDAEMYDEAKGVFEEILYAQPKSDKVLYYLGSLCQQLGEVDQSISYFARISAESSLYHDGNIQVGQMLSSLAVQDYLKGEHKNIDRFKKFISSDVVTDSEAKIEFAIVEASYYEAIEKVEQAIEVVTKISHLKDFNEDHGYYLVSLLDRVNRSAEALEIMRGIVDKNPENADALNYIGYTLVEQGRDLDQAYEMIMKAMKLKPDDGYIRDSLGWYYYKKGDYHKALVEIKRAWEMVGTDSIITKHLGLIYKELKKYSSAKEFYQKALKQCTREEDRQDILQELRELEYLKRRPASTK